MSELSGETCEAIALEFLADCLLRYCGYDKLKPDTEERERILAGAEKAKRTDAENILRGFARILARELMAPIPMNCFKATDYAGARPEEGRKEAP